MPTALTVYGITTASTTLSTADQLIATGGGSAASTAVSSFLLSSGVTGWVEQISNGGLGFVTPTGSQGAPTGKGWLFDVTTLEGYQLVLGNYIFNFDPTTSQTFTADVKSRFYVRSSGGVYTLIDSATASAIVIASGGTPCSASTSSTPAKTFNTGDKLYWDVWYNITAGPSNTATVQYFPSSSTTAGWTGCDVVTPGYALPSSGPPFSSILISDNLGAGIITGGVFG